MVRSRITDALDRAMAEAGADREGLGAVAALLVEDLAAWTTCAASTTVHLLLAGLAADDIPSVFT